MAADTDTLILSYSGFQSYYNTRLKYPNCVVEEFSGWVETDIKRESLHDKFRPDPAVDPALQYTYAQYTDYITFGGSFGHHAPAASHKTSVEAYLQTFYFTNLCPQEGTFNAGLWQLVERWVQRVIESHSRVTVLTGSVGGEDCTFYDSRLNVPRSMYKIVIAEAKYIRCFLCPNTPVGSGSMDIDDYESSLDVIVSLVFTHNDFDLRPLLPLLLPIEEFPRKERRRGKSEKSIITKTKLYEAIIYAPTLEDLEVAVRGRKLNSQFQRYYDISLKRLTSSR